MLRFTTTFATLRRGMAAAAALSLALTLPLTGCGSMGAPAPPPQVRVIDASSDAPGLDLYQDDRAVVYNLGFGSVTSYVSVEPGAADLSAARTGTREALATRREALGAGNRYTIVVGGTASAVQQVVLKDQTTPAPPGLVALRVVHQSVTSGPVDVYLMPSATVQAAPPAVLHLVVGGESGYVAVPAGAYRMVVLPAHRSSTLVDALYRGESILYTASSVRTLVLLDAKPREDGTLQVVTANDYDPPAPLATL